MSVMTVNMGARPSRRRTCLSSFLKDPMSYPRECLLSGKETLYLDGQKSDTTESGRSSLESWHTRPKLDSLSDSEEYSFARNKDRSGRLDAELPGVVALVDGNTDAVARINEHERIANGDVHESFHVGQDHQFFVYFDLYRIAEVVGQLLELVAGDIGDQGAEG